MARDFPAILEVKTYRRLQYPDHYGDKIDQVIEDVYGEAMVARVAHSESLASHPAGGRAKLESEIRSPTALTMAVLGLLSEDYVIGEVDGGRARARCSAVVYPSISCSSPSRHPPLPFPRVNASCASKISPRL